MNHASRIGARSLILAALLCLVVGVTGPGCRKGGTAQQASTSDANGYVCAKCQTKFYVPDDVFADKCPSCGAMEVVEVIGFVCDSCGNLNLAPKGPEAVPCAKCGARAGSKKLPRADELADWGAVKKSAADVRE